MHANELNLGIFAVNIQDGILVLLENNVVYANPGIERMLGYTPGGLDGATLDCFLPLDPSSHTVHRLNEGQHEATFKRKDGSQCPLEITAFSVNWHSKPATILMARETSVHKGREAALQESDALFRQVTDNIREIFFVRDELANRFIYISPAYEDIWKRPVAELYANPLDFVEAIHPDDRQQVMEGLHRYRLSRAQEAVFHYRIVRSNDEVRWIRSRIFPIPDDRNGSHLVAGTADDITDIKLAEHALQASEERLRRSLQYANVGSWEWNIQTGELFWSERVASLFGYEPGSVETTYAAFLNAIHPDDRQMVVNAINDSLETGRDYEIDHRVIWPDATIHWLNETGGVLYNEQGEATHMLGVVRDITKRRITELALTSSEEKYRTVMENAGDAILLATMGGWIIEANHRAEEYFGYTRDELLGMHASAIHPKSDHPVLQAAFRDLTGKGSSLYEHQVLRKDGNIVNAEVAGTAISYQGEKRVMGVFRDITARKRAEEERLAYARAQRDTLVREVHHRIKNNLQGVVGLLRQHAIHYPQISNQFESAINQVNTIAIVHGLYSQDNKDKIILCDLVRAICQSSRGLTGKIDEPLFSVEIDVEHPLRLASDEAVPMALILNELINNAIKHYNGINLPIVVKLLHTEEIARLSILNPGAQLPPDLDFRTGQKLGTGLRLVKSLLPRTGCQLRITTETAGVVAEVVLTHPVLTFKSQ